MAKARPRMVFLDAGTVDYGDGVSFAELEKLGEFKAFYSTPPARIASRCRNADIVMVNKCRLDARALEQSRKLRLVAVSATGVNNVDLKAASNKGIAVANVAGYSTETVVQCTFAFLLALAGNLVKFNKAAHDGTWSRSPFFTLGLYPVREVAGKTLGIVGYGTIGRRVAEIARAFGMNVEIARIPGRKYGEQRRMAVPALAARADFLTIHAPLTDSTRNLIDGTILRKMKRGACLINMARGGIVNEQALGQALKSGRLAGAALDVMSQEPPPRNHPLLGAPNLLLTPHIAWASLESRRRLVHELAMNARAFLSGRKRNRVV
jgi:glycerate dehydrogenase